LHIHAQHTINPGTQSSQYGLSKLKSEPCLDQKINDNFNQSKENYRQVNKNIDLFLNTINKDKTTSKKKRKRKYNFLSLDPLPITK
jgi:hypothetical protein